MTNNGGIRATVVLDSIHYHGGECRLTTMELRYPRFIHSEFLTHRDRARNSASSRAIPWARWKPGIDGDALRDGVDRGEVALARLADGLVENCMMSMVLRDPVVPLSFDREQRGMQSGDAVPDQEAAIAQWLFARDEAVLRADRLARMGIHKSIVNRIVEPWMWITTLCTATEWKNFLRLRDHPAAEKHFRALAVAIREALEASVPREREEHLPYGDDIEDHHYRGAISAARCARVSYLTHDGKRDLEADLELSKRLMNPGDGAIHASPFEHVASAGEKGEWSGPFNGWIQMRKAFANENVEG